MNIILVSELESQNVDEQTGFLFLSSCVLAEVVSVL